MNDIHADRVAFQTENAHLLIGMLRSVNNSRRIRERVSRLQPSTSVIKVILDDCDAIVGRLRILSRTITDMRVPYGQLIRDIKEIQNKYEKLPDSLGDYTIRSDDCDNISWLSHYAILEVRDFISFRKSLSYYNDVTYAELKWIHNGMIVVCNLIREHCMNILSSYGINLIYLSAILEHHETNIKEN